jgi:hypothetical protein
MKEEKANLSPIDAQIGTLRASGCTITQISKEVGLSRTAVCRRSNKADVKAFIQSLSEQLAMQTAGKIIDNHRLALEVANRTWQEIAAQENTEDACRLASQAKDLLEMADKKEKRSGQSMGIFPTPGTNIFLQNIFHGPTNVVMSDQVAKLIGNATRGELSDLQDDEDDIVDLVSQYED